MSYGAYGVVDWDRSVEPQEEKVRGGDLPMWQKAMFMPGAKQMSHLAKLMNSVDFGAAAPATEGRGQTAGFRIAGADHRGREH